MPSVYPGGMTDHGGTSQRRRVIDGLVHRIAIGELGPGARLPGENRLAQEYSVSRGTVRQALAELQRQHRIETRTGIGSFVNFDGAALDFSLSWKAALTQAGVATETETVLLERRDDPGFAREYDLPTAAFVAVDRVRRISDGPAISLERSLVPATADLADLPETGLAGGSLGTELERAGLTPHHGESWAGARPLSEGDAGLLGRPPGTVFLHMVRLAFTADDSFSEHVTSFLDPERFRLHHTFGTTP